MNVLSEYDVRLNIQVMFPQLHWYGHTMEKPLPWWMREDGVKRTTLCMMVLPGGPALKCKHVSHCSNTAAAWRKGIRLKGPSFFLCWLPKHVAKRLCSEHWHISWLEFQPQFCPRQTSSPWPDWGSSELSSRLSPDLWASICIPAFPSFSKNCPPPPACQ